jgi:hypothetical protein
VAATRLGVFGSANVQARISKSAGATMRKPRTNESFGPLKQINAGHRMLATPRRVLVNGPAVVLPHGRPYEEPGNDEYVENGGPRRFRGVGREVQHDATFRTTGRRGSN